MYVVIAETGYEYHDDYVPTGTRTLEIPVSDAVYNMSTAERAALDELLGDDDGFENRWARITSISFR